MLNQRELEIIKFLIENKKISSEELSEKYNVSERTIRQNIKNINDFLNIKGLSKIYTKNSLYFMDTDQDFQKIQNIFYDIRLLTQNERLDLMELYLCLEDSLNLTRISEELMVSRTTIKNDFNYLMQKLLKYNIHFKYSQKIGYYIEGNKSTLNDYIYNRLNKFCKYFIKDNIEDSFQNKINELFLEKLPKNIKISIKEFLKNIEKKLQIELTVESYKIIFLKIILIMLKKNCDIENRELYESFLKDTQEYKIIEKDIKILSKKIKYEFTKEEILEITDYIMGMTISHNNDYFLENWIHVEILVKMLINTFNKMSEIDISNDKILFDFLIYHIKPTLYRIMRGLKLDNMIIEDFVIKETPVIEKTKKLIKIAEKNLKIKFPEEEIILLAYHFKAAIQRNINKKNVRILLVCGLGYGTSKLLEKTILENFKVDIIDTIPNHKLQDALKQYKNIDIILSTININTKTEKPIIKIDPFKENDVIEKLDEYKIERNHSKIKITEIFEIIESSQKIKNKELLAERLYKKYPNIFINNLKSNVKNISNFINEQNVKIIQKAENWEDAIAKGGELLPLKGIKKQDYINQMQRIVKEYGTYIVFDEGVAIPHGSIEPELKNFVMSILVLKEPVYFPDGRSVNILFCFATNNKNSHMFFLDDLFYMMRNLNIREEFTKFKEEKQLINFIKKILCD
ncbi:MAG: hypothetical protein PWP28_1557 [Oceanotoga sp.]|jgi:transcriptional antiterminator/mannitol/fructose-specific phosphotransferase system IIA component (Ntr-type)|uniref:BglG family transcription antiterminator n=1 Tax=Oceanotoga sp. TaxID=2108366 RepID=UPI00264F897F|nr:BglG family transcription antiterminator [Oceanotoga sp.]MDN5342682.1 hypothetical protein [Oceanotoga sp.]